MKKLIFTLALFVIATITQAQTVGDKSIALGYDLGQKVLDTGVPIQMELAADSSFVCYKIEAPIPADSLQNGSTQNFYYFCSVMHDTTLTINSTVAEIEASYKAWLAAQPYTEKEVEKILTIKE